MERLTNKREADAQRKEYENRIRNGYPRNIPEERFLRLAAYEDTGLTPDVCAEYKKFEDEAISKNVTFSRLVELMEASADERIVVLPCRMDATAWVIENPWTGKLLKKPLEAEVDGMKMYSHGLYVNVLFDTREISGSRDYGPSRFGKTIFYTREEAEAALKGARNGRS